MKIIFIHGMNQQNYNEATLKQYWLNIFQIGLNNAQQNFDITSLDINMPGEFKHEVRQFQKPYDNQQAEQISLMV